jgi:hypothetical protein
MRSSTSASAKSVFSVSTAVNSGLGRQKRSALGSKSVPSPDSPPMSRTTPVALMRNACRDSTPMPEMAPASCSDVTSLSLSQVRQRMTSALRATRRSTLKPHSSSPALKDSRARGISTSAVQPESSIAAAAFQMPSHS